MLGYTENLSRFSESKMNWWSGEISVLSEGASEHLQTQIPLFSMDCGMN